MNQEFKNLLIDFYELTMGQGYFNKKIHNNVAYFDLFFRKVPDKGSFVIANGVKKCAKYLEQFHFSKEDMDYLRSLNRFSEEYLKELENFLTEEEQDIVRRGRNANPHSTAKNADIVEYKYATGFEALIGFLHLSEQKERLNEILKKCVEIVTK